MDARAWLLLAVAGALAGPACSWHPPGQVDAAVPAPRDVPGPARGMDMASVLAVARATEQGEFSVGSEVIRVAKVRGAEWEDVPLNRAARSDFGPEAGADYVVVALRTCSDWESRERWSDERSSWFLLHGGQLEAFDHWAFGPRCSVANRFRPSAEGAPNRATERDLLRWLEQRHPPGRLPAETRFGRGYAYLAAGRLVEARSMLKFGDDAIQTREDLFEVRVVGEDERAAYERETERLRGLRGDLSDAIRRAEAERGKRAR